MRQRPSLNTYKNGIQAGDRIILSQAITLVESTLLSDRQLALQLIIELIPYPKDSLRMGITGIPGVGKSTFIEAIGKEILKSKRRLAILAVDPSSTKNSGSILADKTRMEELSQDPNVFIRPSPASGSLGGVARNTRETILLCESAGFDTIIVETVGVGQSEILVKEMTDFFLLLMLAGAGDELQGIKRGIIEMVDMMVINKADGDNHMSAKLAANQYKNALHYLQAPGSGFPTEVLTCSSLEKKGIPQIWNVIQAYHKHTLANGYFEKTRQNQNISWMHDSIQNNLIRDFYTHVGIKKHLGVMEKAIIEGKEHPLNAAKIMLDSIKILS